MNNKAIGARIKAQLEAAPATPERNAALVVLAYALAGGKLSKPERLSAALALAERNAGRGQAYALTDAELSSLKLSANIVERGEIMGHYLLAS